MDDQQITVVPRNPRTPRRMSHTTQLVLMRSKPFCGKSFSANTLELYRRIHYTGLEWPKPLWDKEKFQESKAKQTPSASRLRSGSHRTKRPTTASSLRRTECG